MIQEHEKEVKEELELSKDLYCEVCDLEFRSWKLRKKHNDTEEHRVNKKNKHTNRNTNTNAKKKHGFVAFCVSHFGFFCFLFFVCSKKNVNSKKQNEIK